MSVTVHSLGCRLNLSESETLRAMLDDAGADAPELVVVNSCAVTAEAVRQTRQTIRRARRERPDARLLVTGCAAETERDMLGAMAEVDGLVSNAAKLDPRAWNRPVRPAPYPVAERAHTRAFVQVQNGCDHACTFCVIPQGRGASRSRTVHEVVAEVRAHRDAGVNEVVLTGVDLTSWGSDLPGRPALGRLCAALLDQVPDLARLRLSSIDGAEIDPQLFDLLSGEPRLMPHVHLSLQHGADIVLKRMKRRHSRADALALVEALHRARPAIAIGADLIAGFPTEDEAAHAASLSIVHALPVVHGHVFTYSRRPGTPAARMPQVDGARARERAAELREAVAQERTRWLLSHIGQPLEVLAERGASGHAPDFAPVRVPAGTAPGTLVTVIPTRVSEGILEA